MLPEFLSLISRALFGPSKKTQRKKTRRLGLGLEQLEQLVMPATDILQPAYVMTPTDRVAPMGSPGPVGLSPATVRHAYGFDQITFSNGTIVGDGTGTTIAIVDAYDDPTIAADLANFCTTFGLPQADFTKVGINSSGQASYTSFPPPNQAWAREIELDVQWAHAIAPGAKILLVEAANSSTSALMAAVDWARAQPGVVAISMSWGSTETSGEANYDSHFTTPAGHGGITFFGASGDNGSPGIWPAISSHVVAVGGTTLTTSSGNYVSESAWSGSGGSLSAYIAQPSYQQGLVISNGSSTISANGMRAGPDVAYNANPGSGFAVLGTYGFGGWAQVGGTSAGAPQWAALMAIANQGRAIAGLGSLDGFTQTLPALYGLPSTDFHDILTGSNGYSAGTGFDLATGRGSPIANLIVADLVGVSSTPPGGASQPPTVATVAKVVSQTSTTATLSVLGSDDGGEAGLKYTWKVASGPAATFSANGTNAAKNTTATFSAAGTYTLQVTITDAGGLSAISQVTVSVSATLTSVKVTPGSSTVAPGAAQSFTAAALDQFGKAMATQPPVTWSLGQGSVGTLSTSGMYTAPSANGSAVVQATAGGLTGKANVTVGTVATFSDDFSGGMGNWKVTGGGKDFSIVDNRLQVKNRNSAVDSAVAGQSNWADYSYQATLDILSDSKTSAGLMARVQDTNHYYVFGYSISLGEWMIAKRSGNTTTILAHSASAIAYGTDYTVRADLSGSSLKLYVGGVLTVSATDSSYTQGQIGFTATNALAQLDNVVVNVSGLSPQLATGTTSPRPAGFGGRVFTSAAQAHQPDRSWLVSAYNAARKHAQGAGIDG